MNFHKRKQLKYLNVTLDRFAAVVCMHLTWCQAIIQANDDLSIKQGPME